MVGCCYTTIFGNEKLNQLAFEKENIFISGLERRNKNKIMTVENIFEFASRNKVRFPFKGMISVEDLWDLSLTNLDSIYKTLNKQVKQSEEESLLSTKASVDTELEVQIAIVKHIVSVKLAEKEAAEKASAKKAQKQKIMSIIATKQDEALQNSSIDDLKKMLDELGD